jgi:hypothetical protein
MSDKPNRLKGSDSLAELARRFGVKVNNPVGYEPESGRFISADDYVRKRRLYDQAQMIWLLDIGQRESDSLIPSDDLMLRTFVGPNVDIEEAPQPRKLLHVAKESLTQIRRGILERTPWEFQIPAMTHSVEWFGQGPISRPKTTDWQAAFRLRASALLIEFYDRIGECARNDCKRLFLALNTRKEFCSKKCSDKEQFERYVENIGGKDEWLKKHREQYHTRKSETDAQADSSSSDPSEAAKHPKPVKQRSSKTL